MRLARRTRSIGIVVATAAALAPAAAQAALTGPEQINLLNAQRAAHGLPADVAHVQSWSDGCKKHMDYLALNHKFQHEEVSTDPGYTPEGHTAGTSSVLVSSGDAFYPAGFNAFELAPIHLAQMLSPFITVSGADRGCLVTLASPRRAFAAPTTFSYPGDGAKHVRTSELSYEFPFVPAASVGLNKPGDITRSTQIGPSIYFFHASQAGEWNSRGTITAASLIGPDGPIEIKTVDNDTPKPAGAAPSAAPLGNYLAPGGILMPTKPLPDDTTFTASVTFQPRGGVAPVSRTWTFSTGNGSPVTPAPKPPATTGPIPVGETTVVWTTTPSTSKPLQPMDPSQVPGALPKPTNVKLRARELSFVAPLTGKVSLQVFRSTKTKKGKTKEITVLQKTVAITAGRTVKVKIAKKVPKGNYVLRFAQRGSGTMSAEVSVTRK